MSKIWNDAHEPDLAIESVERLLDDLGLTIPGPGRALFEATEANKTPSRPPSEVLQGRDDIMGDILLCARQFASANVLDRVWEINPELGQRLESVFAALPSFEEPPTIVRATSFGSTDYSVINR